MLTEKQCYDILNKDKVKITKEQAKEIRSLLYLIAEVELKNEMNHE